MKRHVVIFGVVGGLLVIALQWIQYRFLIVEHSVEIYGALIAATFAGFGIWLGLRLTRGRSTVIIREIQVPGPAIEVVAPVELAPEPFIPNEGKRDQLGITRRELEILGLVAQGMSNREIAGKLYVSENTVKTHCSRAFDKLGARRRTQAVQLGKEFGLLP